MLSGVLFDLDDTLVDHASATRSAVSGWAAQYGLVGPEVVSRWQELLKFHYARYERRELTFQEQRRARVRDLLGVTASDTEVDKMFADYRSRYEAAQVVFDDATPTLRRVREAGLATAVLTNGEESQQRRTVERLGLACEIGQLISTSTLPAAKPDRRAFLTAARHLRCRPADLLMVGDSLHHDVRGALAAGMQAVLLDRYDAYVGPAIRRVRSLLELELTSST